MSMQLRHRYMGRSPRYSQPTNPPTAMPTRRIKAYQHIVTDHFGDNTIVPLHKPSTRRLAPMRMLFCVRGVSPRNPK